MIKKSYHLFLSALLLLAGTGFNTLIAQEADNPNFDRIPEWYLNQPPSKEVQSAQVITIDGYDNFFLGVDFAESHITVNPQDPKQFFTSFNIDAPRGTTDGYDWYNSSVNWGTIIRGDIVLAYDSVGNLYYENMYGSSSILGCKVVVSGNNGQSWSNAATAISGVDKNWIAADQTGGPYSNYVYTVMTSSGGGNFARSTNFGASWSNTWSFGTQSLPGMMVCVGPNGSIQGGSVYVVTNSGNAFSSNYTFYRSTNGGSSFQLMSSQYFAGYVGSNVNGRHSVENMRTRPYPFITADNSYGPHRGRLYCIYASNDPPGNGNKPDIWCRYSDNGGSTWSSAIKVNDDPNTTANHQFAPATWCDYKTGKLYIQWMDTRDTPTSDSALIYATYSDDGGVTFKPNVAISNEKMKINCTSCGGSGSPRYQGDYNGIVSNPKVSMAVWTDFRYGSYGSFTTYFPDFAMTVSPETLEITYKDTLYVNIPDVKLYEDTVLFSASIADPPSGSFIVEFPEGNMLTSFPGSVPVVITADNVPLGSYALEIKGEGPNGTPVHYRTATLELNELPLPVVDFSASDSTICAGETIQFTDQTLFFPTQWFWTFEGGSPSSSNEQNPVVAYSTPGNYDVTLIAVNSSGYTELTKSEYISVGTAPEPPVAEDVYGCLPWPVPPLTATGENITWYDDESLSNPVGYGNSFETGETEPGIYPYWATAGNNGCESEPVQVTLYINNSPEASFDPLTPVCSSEDPFELTGGAPSGGMYAGPGVTSPMFDPGVAGPGTHEILYIYTDENFCSDTAAQNIEVLPAPEVMLGPDTSICADVTYTLDASAGGAVSWLWSPGGETTPSITVDSSGTGIGSQSYSVEVTGENGCITLESVTITFIDCSGIAELTGLSAITIFPNPNDGEMTVRITASEKTAVQLSLYDARGKRFYHSGELEVKGKTNIPVVTEQAGSGVYYLKICTGKGSVTRKVLIR
ncbi:MAG: hypothetical protein Kow00127_24660 [Bacteroidales bacterium]